MPTESSRASITTGAISASGDYNKVVELNIEKEENLEDQGNPSKTRKRTSDVWKEMSRLTDPDGSVKAQCNWSQKNLLEVARPGLQI